MALSSGDKSVKRDKSTRKEITKSVKSNDFEIKKGVLIRYKYKSGRVIIPENITSIGDYAFKGCWGLTNITLSNNLTSIGKCAFQDCSNLTSIIIGNNMQSIGDYAFENCDSLRDITIGAKVSSIGVMAFGGGINIDFAGDSITWSNELESINVESGNIKYHSRDNCLIETETNKLILGCKNSIIPNYVTAIDDFAFYNCKKLTSLTIGDGISIVGCYALKYCNNLKEIRYGGTKRQWKNLSVQIGSLRVVHCKDGVIINN